MGRKEALVKELQQFAQHISKDYPLKKMILFGSQVTGKAGRDSDVDLILVSEKFRRQSILKRSPPLYLQWDLDYPVDFLCYTPEEFVKKKKHIGIVQQAVKEGIEITAQA
ncbi:MAG: nucleotidyltransferase domain-containing protein [Nanoarchaeota archaeon]|nr:nucleotidyltransferase domain-containing protein [Nanoarchaeota archaeon]